MKKSTITTIIIAVAIVIIGVILLLSDSKPCAEMDEEECKMTKDCVSVLVPVPCDTEPCTDAEFKECKNKTK